MSNDSNDEMKLSDRPGMDISYSRVNTYRTCPWKYKIIYEDGLYVPANPSISLGLSVHRALEDFHSRKADSFEEMTESFDKSWVNAGFNSPQLVQEFYEKGLGMLENYWNENRNSKTEILFIEKDFRFALGKNHLRGIIDRVDLHPDGTHEVIDYKTHAEIWTQERVDNDLQLSIYAVACRNALGFSPEVLSCYFLAHNQRISTKRLDKQLAEAVETLNIVAEKISLKDFSPEISHCPRCDFRKICTRCVNK